MNRDMRAANYLLLIFSMVSIALLSLPLTGKVGTFRACAAYLLNPVPYYGERAYERLSALPAEAARIISADIELQNARRALEEAEYLKAELESMRLENERLLRAAAMAPAGLRAIRWARVMQREPLNWHSSLIVMAGAEDGVEVSAPVLGILGTEMGVVGRVTEVSDKTSKVRLLTDELSSLAAYIPSRGWEGLIQGQGTDRLRLNYLPVDAEIEVGERVYTSPTSATFAADLPIGTVVKIFDKDPFLAFQSVEVRSIVGASLIKEVLILVPKGPEGK